MIMISQMDNQNNDSPKQSHSDFSIEHILNRAGNSSNTNQEEIRNQQYPLDPYSWLHCTRYCPPKIPRGQKKEGPQKRQLGRHPRIPFTSHQLSILEEKFKQSAYLSSEEVIVLSKKLDLADIRVKIWFQNRRARERRERSSDSSSSPTKEKPNYIAETATSSSTTIKLENNAMSPLRISPAISPNRVSPELLHNSPVNQSPTQIRLSPTVFYRNTLISGGFLSFPSFFPNVSSTTNSNENR